MYKQRHVLRFPVNRICAGPNTACDERQKDCIGEVGRDTSLIIMAKIDARASMTQIAQLANKKGVVTDACKRIIPTPIRESFREACIGSLS